MGAVYFRWGEKDYDSRRELVDAIQEFLQSDIDDRWLSEVTIDGVKQKIRVNVSLEKVVGV